VWIQPVSIEPFHTPKEVVMDENEDEDEDVMEVHQDTMVEET